MKEYFIREAAAHLEDRGQKAIWQDAITGVVRFCDFDDLPKRTFIELSERELLDQAERARLVLKALGR